MRKAGYRKGENRYQEGRALRELRLMSELGERAYAALVLERRFGYWIIVARATDTGLRSRSVLRSNAWHVKKPWSWPHDLP